LEPAQEEELEIATQKRESQMRMMKHSR
jgi:hypothetical protein